MKHRLRTAFLTLGLGSGLVLASAPTAEAWSPTLAQILLADRVLDDANGFDRFSLDFDIVTQAVLAFPDLTEAVSNRGSNLTVFLPTDGAFRATYQALTGQYISGEKALFDAYVSALGLPAIKEVLTYHLISGARISYSTAVASDGAQLTTVNGQTIEVDVTGSWIKRVTLIDKAPTRDPMVIVPNVRAANGIAHAIDRVLIPTIVG
jgi:uncharacterized surface protein with fasciclin (FAS1) repeats